MSVSLLTNFSLDVSFHSLLVAKARYGLIPLLTVAVF